MQTMKAQHEHIGRPVCFLKCGKTLNVAPGFAVEVTRTDGTVEGYLHPRVCREKWEEEHPGFQYGRAE
jgi:hypothetical protein